MQQRRKRNINLTHRHLFRGTLSSSLGEGTNRPRHFWRRARPALRIEAVRSIEDDRVHVRVVGGGGHAGAGGDHGASEHGASGRGGSWGADDDAVGQAEAFKDYTGLSYGSG